MSKFQLKCCCVVCKTETTTQSLKAHLKTHEPKRLCKQCGKPIYTNEKEFCSRSCSAKYNNIRKDYTKFKPGPQKGVKPKTYIPYTPISYCAICGKGFSVRSKCYIGRTKTCSKTCTDKFLSEKMKSRIRDGFNPIVSRNQGPSKMERDFKLWLQTYYPEIKFITEHQFKNATSAYFVDFYFPELELIVELDGQQHQHSKEYDQTRDLYIKEHYGIETVRISYLEFRKKTKYDKIEKLFKINELLERPPGNRTGYWDLEGPCVATYTTDA